MNRQALSIPPGDVFSIHAPSRGIDHIVVRVGDIEDATLTDGTISLTVMQDVFTLDAATYLAPQGSFWVPPDRTARVIERRLVEEMTYRDLAENLPTAELAAVTDDTGIIKVFAGTPGGLSSGYEVWTEAAGETAFVSRSIAGFDDTANLSTALDYYDTAVTFSPVGVLSNEAIGQPVLIGEEYCRIDAVGLTTLTIARGCIDTVPIKHPAGEKIWFQTHAPTTDFRDYATSEVISVKLLTRTSSELLDGALAHTDAVTIAGRQGRPYPPGDVRAAGFRIYDPDGTTGGYLVVIGDIVLTWTHRDRIIEANFLLEHGAASTGPEVGTTYTVRVYDGADSTPTTLLRTTTAISAATWTYTTAMGVADGSPASVWFELESVRAGLASHTKYQFVVRRVAPGFDDDFDFYFSGT